MHKILILDDMAIRHDSLDRQFLDHFKDEHVVTHVYTGPEAIKALDKESFDIVFLDHDLSDSQSAGIVDGALTGMDVAKHILTLERKPKRVVIHSWNMPRARAMAALLSCNDMEILFAPFSTVGMHKCLLFLEI